MTHLESADEALEQALVGVGLPGTCCPRRRGE